MTISPRTIATIVFLTAVSIGAVAVTVYTFLGRLADTSVVGAVVDRLGWRAEMDPPDASSMPDPMPAVTELAVVGSAACRGPDRPAAAAAHRGADGARSNAGR